ncbi:Mitochondrial carrier protein [Rutstroemia sp. NJR-2017a BBW]|nr:Mitochondrial carrier protein [Rutstroemia sp. NJR-2017a BBW]
MKRAVRAAVIAIVLFLNVVVAFLYLRNVFSIFDLLGAPIDGYIPRPVAEGQDRAVVIGHLEEEDISWVGEYLPDWQSYIYSVDNPNADLHTINKGHESIVYLTYIIDNYDDLPSTIAFLHAHQYGWWDAWHTDVPGHDNVVSLNTLNLDLVQEQGYMCLEAWMPASRYQGPHTHQRGIVGSDIRGGRGDAGGNWGGMLRTVRSFEGAGGAKIERGIHTFPELGCKHHAAR